ncbi:hypothetical protein F5050DRAFT_1715224 [Lentinula boryana]|uniref:Uncharacterized protein n=1 Tax=Lentinula boryana TaxID=40481 RepID=A0ABQ8Q223_9AGAR|nr:hypothetical protein F5050DRAFT_1715224 [Lentinula boryana]
MVPPMTRQAARRNRPRTLISTTDNLDIPTQAEEPNPFVANAQSFTPYSESISALGGRRRTNVFGPTTAASLPTTEIVLEVAIGGTTETMDYEFQTLYTASGMPVQVRTPRRNTHIATTSSNTIIPPSPTAATIMGQILSCNTPTGPQIPEGPEDEEGEDLEGSNNRENQDGEEVL